MASGTYPGVAYPGSAYPGHTSSSPPTGGSGTINFTGSGQLTLADPGPPVGRLDFTGSGQLTLTGSGSTSTGPNIYGAPDPDNEPPRILVQASNLTGSTATVVRVGPDDIPVPVRAPTTVNSGTWIAYDYEAPFNVPVVYRITSGTQVLASPPVTLQVGRPWLIHPGVPSLSQPLTVKVLEDETDDATVGVFQIIGRERPIVRTDGVRKAPTFQVQIKTGSAEERQNLKGLLQDMSPLLLQVVYPQFTAESDYLWVSVGAVTRSRVSPARYGDTSRVWTLPVITVDRPAGLIQSERTWADVMAENATWDDVQTSYVTWRGVLVGIRGT